MNIIQIPLSVHVENEQPIYFTVENAQTRTTQPPNSTLTEYFLLCKQIMIMIVSRIMNKQCIIILNFLKPSELPHHKIILKIVSPIMLLRNIDAPKLCVTLKILTGNTKGESVFIPGIPLIPPDMPFDFKRLQFPVRLAFAITINKFSF